MGGGGERGSRADSRGEGGGVSRAKTMGATSARAPSVKPPFTVSDLRKAIPTHCFQRSLLRSSAYLAFDLTLVALLLYSTRFFSLPSLPFQPLTSTLLWAAYMVVQGWVCTGIWVIAHECGHGAFSDYGVVNDAVGMFLHTWLLVPYFSWKYSHRRHHSNTGSIERDEVFVPKRRAELAPYAEVMQHPMGRIAHIVITLTLGWPLYLTFNATGRKYDGVANHFDPYSHIFNARERLWVVVSDVGLLAVLAALTSLARSYGIVWLLKVYVAPLMVVNLYLVLITLLQHTHPAVPHYDDSEWDWLRGALATIDRDYGFLNTVFHNIADTHVAHHLFSAMPHYHAREATEAIKPVLGTYYQRDDTPIVEALWRELRECVYVEPDANGPKGVLWYSNKLRSE